MDERKLLGLIEKLAEKTKQQKVLWMKTTDSSVFIAVFSSYSVMLSSFYDQDFINETNYLIKIVTSNGDTIEMARSEELEAYNRIDEHATAINYYDLLRDMHIAARRKALGIDDAIKAIMLELDDEIPF